MMALSVGSKQESPCASASGLQVGVLWSAPSVPPPCPSAPVRASATSAGEWKAGEARADGASNRDRYLRVRRPSIAYSVCVCASHSTTP